MRNEKECIFCKIVNKELDSYKIYEDEKVYVFLDNAPDSNGHMLIVPKKHLVDTSDILLEEGLLEHMVGVAQQMRKKIKETIGTKGITYLWNMDNAQEVKHFHMHIIPRDKTEQSEKLPVEEVYKRYFQK